VVAGGAGTVVGALARGVPLVVLPLVFDQRVNAERAAAVGAAVIAEHPGQVAAAVRRVLADPSVRGAARVLAGQIAAMDPPDDAWRRLAQMTLTWVSDTTATPVSPAPTPIPATEPAAVGTPGRRAAG